MQTTYKVLLNQLVAVTPKDKVIGPIDKWNAHLNTYITSQEAIPHRAFSIFLFNSKNQLMFQRRSADKKTFPLCWTNTCCSHPNMIQKQGSDQKDVQHIRDALHRALHRELRMDLTKEKFYLVDKIFYKAQGRKGEQFGEFEVDYVFLSKLKTPNVEYDMVSEEVCEVEWVAKDDMKNFLQKKTQNKCEFSPWFMKMYNNGLLYEWWDNAITGKLADVGTQDGTPVRDL